MTSLTLKVDWEGEWFELNDATGKYITSGHNIPDFVLEHTLRHLGVDLVTIDHKDACGCDDSTECGFWLHG